MLTIYGRDTSINVRKVLWTCVELGLAFEREDWGAGFRPTSDPAFRALNPNGLIPAIRDGDFVLWQSNTIIRYLATRYGGESIYPAEAQARAHVDQWIDWQATELNNAWSYAFMALVRQSPGHQDPAAIASSCEVWTSTMAILDRQLSMSEGFVAGAAFSLADVPIGLSVQRWFATPFDKPNFTAVNTYFEQLTERTGFREFGRNGMP